METSLARAVLEVVINSLQWQKTTRRRCSRWRVSSACHLDWISVSSTSTSISSFSDSNISKRALSSNKNKGSGQQGSAFTHRRARGYLSCSFAPLTKGGAFVTNISTRFVHPTAVFAPRRSVAPRDAAYRDGSGGR